MGEYKGDRGRAWSPHSTPTPDFFAEERKIEAKGKKEEFLSFP